MRIRGKCQICRKIDLLTNEHVPPQKAFNSYKSLLYSGDEIVKHITSDKFPWDLSERKSIQKQGGIGFHRLCTRCNNNTGSWYGPSFVDFTFQGIKPIVQNLDKKSANISFKNVYPLRIAKQIICMFLAINSPAFPEKNKLLSSLVLNKTSKGLDERYRLYMYGFKGPIVRYLGVNAKIKAIRSQAPNNIIVSSEISAIPFGYVLQFKPISQIENLVDIYDFFNCEYDQSTNLEIEIPLLECNTAYPLDFRTQQEIIARSSI